MTLFNIPLDAAPKIEKWVEFLDTIIKEKKISRRTGAAGGRFTYSFTPTGLGTIVKIHDALTNETLDVTSYEEW
jgi:hypothetical protein